MPRAGSDEQENIFAWPNFMIFKHFLFNFIALNKVYISNH